MVRIDIDRLAGGRYGHYVVAAEGLAHPKTRRAFTAVLWILAAETVVGLSALVIAGVMLASGDDVPLSVWWRSIVVLGITVTLFFFAARARRGYWWAYSRLRLFSQIFPVITFILAAIPGLYPLWMVIEQIVFSVLLIGLSDFLTSDHMRAVFPRPSRDPAASGTVDR